LNATAVSHKKANHGVLQMAQTTSEAYKLAERLATNSVEFTVLEN